MAAATRSSIDTPATRWPDAANECILSGKGAVNTLEGNDPAGTLEGNDPAGHRGGGREATRWSSTNCT
jgi:hypothetical protein